MPQGQCFDELDGVSDLHLGGAGGFQIFDAGAELAWLAYQVASSAAPGLAAPAAAAPAHAGPPDTDPCGPQPHRA